MRATLDARNEKMQAKIRDAQMSQIPYMAVVGPREAAARQVAVRQRRGGDMGTMPLEAFVSRVQKEDASRSAA